MDIILASPIDCRFQGSSRTRSAYWRANSTKCILLGSGRVAEWPARLEGRCEEPSG